MSSHTNPMEAVSNHCVCSAPNVAAVLGVVLVILFYTNRFVRYHVKNLFCYVIFAFCAGSSVPMLLFNLPHVKYSAIGLFIHYTSKWTCLLYGVTFEPRGLDAIITERGGVVVSNHQSIFDVICFLKYWVEIGRWAAIAKKQIFYIWPMGLGAWMAGTIFIDRSQPGKAKEQLEHTTKLIHRDNTKIIFFPEGTRNRKGTSLLPFKKGAFHIAIASQAPIIPIIFSPYHFIDKQKLLFGSGRVIMTVLPSISTTGLTASDCDDLMERTRLIMQTCFTKLTAEVEADKKSQ